MSLLSPWHIVWVLPIHNYVYPSLVLAFSYLLIFWGLITAPYLWISDGEITCPTTCLYFLRWDLLTFVWFKLLEWWLCIHFPSPIDSSRRSFHSHFGYLRSRLHILNHFRNVLHWIHMKSIPYEQIGPFVCWPS